MASDVGRDEFIDGKRGSSFGRDSTKKRSKNMKLVREVLWDQLRDVSLKAGVYQLSSPMFNKSFYSCFPNLETC